jgi:UDP-N-acetylmuramyl pentapeptide phosphotransferase/UDP-N-acetylglucosamine-1-phosphate transferase
MLSHNALFIANLVSTWYMVGLIWMVQIVHYPLFAKVGAEDYQSYQLSHQTLTTLVVGPPMLIEISTAVLLIWSRPAVIPGWLIYIALGLLAIVWASTAFLQVPCHENLTDGFDAAIHARLVVSNWIRTVCWTARGFLVAWMLAIVLGHADSAVEGISAPPASDSSW